MLSDSKAGSAALCTAAAIFIWGSGCDKDLQQLNVGMKVRNQSPYTMYFNYSLVDENGGDLQNGAVEIKSVWNYTSSDQPNEGDFQWFVFPMLENQNYTARLSIGSEVSRMEAYFTATSIPENDKCSYYYKTDLADACKSVTSITTQFQVAFPFIQLLFGQSFTFNATSAGTYNMAPLGSPGLINCRPGSCSGLGVATLTSNGKNIYENNFFVLMPSVVRNPDVKSTSTKAWSVQKFGDARDNHAQAMVPEFTFLQSSASRICDSSAPDPNKQCQAVKAISTDTAKSELSNTASICKDNTCCFSPQLMSATKTCAVNNGGCADDKECFPEALGSTITCGQKVESCPGNTNCCGNVPQGQKCNQSCFRDATANAGQSQLVCRSFCSQFQATCPSVFDPGTGLVRSKITDAIKNGTTNDYDYLKSVNCNSAEPGLHTVYSILGETYQIARYTAEQKLYDDCSVDVVYICPDGCLPRGGDPKDYCTPYGGCLRASCSHNPSGSLSSQYAGDCSNPDCGDFGVDKATGYCLVPSNCSLKPGREYATSAEHIDDACTLIACVENGATLDCGDCGRCDLSLGACTKVDDTDRNSATCIAQYGNAKQYCASPKVLPPDNERAYTCKSDNCGGCGECGQCDASTDECSRFDSVCRSLYTDKPDCKNTSTDSSKKFWECKPFTCPNECGTCGQCNGTTGACEAIGDKTDNQGPNVHCRDNVDASKPYCLTPGTGTNPYTNQYTCSAGCSDCGECGTCISPIDGTCDIDNSKCSGSQCQETSTNSNFFECQAFTCNGGTNNCGDCGECITSNGSVYCAPLGGDSSWRPSAESSHCTDPTKPYCTLSGTDASNYTYNCSAQPG